MHHMRFVTLSRGNSRSLWGVTEILSCVLRFGSPSRSRIQELSYRDAFNQLNLTADMGNYPVMNWNKDLQPQGIFPEVSLWWAPLISSFSLACQVGIPQQTLLLSRVRNSHE